MTPNNSTLITSLRGPVMLITLGSLLMIDYSGAATFWRTWPILLIVFGFLKLIEHVFAKAPAEHLA